MIQTTIDTTAFRKSLTGVERQLPFAMSKALNDVANEAQREVQLLKQFTVAPARKRFVERLVKRRKHDMASKQKLEATVRIEGPEDSPNTGGILARHEAGGQKQMNDFPMFIPTKALRPTNVSLVPQRMYPKALRLDSRQALDRMGRTVNLPALRKGKRRGFDGLKPKDLRKVGLGGTFIIKPKAGHRGWGIYQRQGEGRDGLVMLWAFRTRISLPKRLHFADTAITVARARIEDIWQRALNYAMRTARG